MNKIKIGISGTATFEDRTLIKSFIFKLKDKKDEVQIVGLGDKHGADKHIKKYALEFGLEYKEVNLPHTPQNLYSLLSENFYNKPYNARNYPMRNKIFVGYIDKCVVFDDSNGKDKKANNLIQAVSKAHKKVVIMNS